jgi:hypothetical protein
MSDEMIGQLLDQRYRTAMLEENQGVDLGLGELSGAYLNGHYQRMERVGKKKSFLLSDDQQESKVPRHLRLNLT